MIPLNLQQAEKPVRREDGKVEVFRMWYTLQGEGPYAGHPAIFIRLAGCNLQCPRCDTDYTSNRILMSPQEVVDKVKAITPKVSIPGVGTTRASSLVVITGGEPFRQDLSATVSGILESGYRVQIETNGTIMFDLSTFPWIPTMIVCSPKTPVINHELKRYIKCLKYVLSADFVGSDGLPTKALGGHAPARPWNGFYGDIIIQPEDTDNPIENKANLEAAARVCLQYGFKLGVQLHKLVGVE